MRSAIRRTWAGLIASRCPASYVEYHEYGAIDDAPQMLTADAWLPRERLDGPRVPMVEHSAVIAPLGVVFSMLWIPRQEIGHLGFGPQ